MKRIHCSVLACDRGKKNTSVSLYLHPLVVKSNKIQKVGPIQSELKTPFGYKVKPSEPLYVANAVRLEFRPPGEITSPSQHFLSIQTSTHSNLQAIPSLLTWLHVCGLWSPQTCGEHAKSTKHMCSCMFTRLHQTRLFQLQVIHKIITDAGRETTPVRLRPSPDKDRDAHSHSAGTEPDSHSRWLYCLFFEPTVCW